MLVALKDAMERKKVPSERAMKTEAETGAKSGIPFCRGLSLGKTNSVK